MENQYDYKKFAVLYVDDEEKSLTNFARAFGDEFQLFTASNVDMVISDHLLQGTTGTELAAEMKRLKPTIPIVIMSAMVQEPEGMEHADLFVVKGEAPALWLKKISDLLQKSRCQTPQSNAIGVGLNCM